MMEDQLKTTTKPSKPILEDTDRSIGQRLYRLEQQLKFFADSYQTLHNILLGKAPSLKFEQERKFNEFLSSCLQVVTNELQKKFDRDSDEYGGTLKFIAQRLDALEKDHTKKINLAFTVDGYEYMRKTKVEDESMTEEKALSLILKGLTEKEVSVLTLYFGLKGGRGKSGAKIENDLGLSWGSSSAIIDKALRKCRNPSVKGYFDYISHKKFRKAVIGQ